MCSPSRVREDILNFVERSGVIAASIKILWCVLAPANHNLLRSIAHVRERAQAAVVEFGGPG